MISLLGMMEWQRPGRVAATQELRSAWDDDDAVLVVYHDVARGHDPPVVPVGAAGAS
ncbi:hypothetical protein [Arthrobacter sp. ZGTC412]|uniref:hypothetical protein n=1 Tax=Arthrobacter sp. ZGTC412 TaxID=2058900 RepID=UPI0015E3C9E4|nr:hypothetical protein [Arthrobacter sp. ZGTC412]